MELSVGNSPAQAISMTTVAEPSDFLQAARRVVDLLGVAKKARRSLGSAILLHEYLNAGLPSRALFAAAKPGGIAIEELLPVFGISVRTLARLKADPDKLLDSNQSARLWRYAAALTNAVDVLGTADLAAEWMTRPAMALENRRPIELLQTEVGAKLVNDVLDRMRYGVYQ
jgi:putative toxin-antitoxin system antitoxin component (TIGR02293 family)